MMASETLAMSPLPHDANKNKPCPVLDVHNLEGARVLLTVCDGSDSPWRRSIELEAGCPRDPGPKSFRESLPQGLYGAQMLQPQCELRAAVPDARRCWSPEAPEGPRPCKNLLRPKPKIPQPCAKAGRLFTQAATNVVSAADHHLMGREGTRLKSNCRWVPSHRFWGLGFRVLGLGFREPVAPISSLQQVPDSLAS